MNQDPTTSFVTAGGNSLRLRQIEGNRAGLPTLVFAASRASRNGLTARAQREIAPPTQLRPTTRRYGGTANQGGKPRIPLLRGSTGQRGHAPGLPRRAALTGHTRLEFAR
jgi:hypothetical protein